jgi:hypothetical protein
VRRTQLYLEEAVWKALHVRSEQCGVSISELVRVAVRERYLDPASTRKEAMGALVGIWKDRTEMEDSVKHVRRLRRGRRLEKFAH